MSDRERDINSKTEENYDEIYDVPGVKMSRCIIKLDILLEGYNK